jgi:transposase
VPAGGDPVELVLPYRTERGTFGWSKDFLEAGMQRLAGDTERQADSRQVSEMGAELEQLRQLVSELSLKNRVLTPALAGGAREKSLLG